MRYKCKNLNEIFLWERERECVCVCVCDGGKKREKKKKREKRDPVSIKENKYRRLSMAVFDRIGQGIYSANIIWKLNEMEVN